MNEELKIKIVHSEKSFFYRKGAKTLKSAKKYIVEIELFVSFCHDGTILKWVFGVDSRLKIKN